MLDSLKNDLGLRPYIFDFIGRSLAVGLSEMYAVMDVSHRARLHKEYYRSLQVLSEKMHEQIPKDKVDEAIQEVLKFYMKDGKNYFNFPLHSDN